MVLKYFIDVILPSVLFVSLGFMKDIKILHLIFTLQATATCSCRCLRWQPGLEWGWPRSSPWSPCTPGWDSPPLMSAMSHILTSGWWSASSVWSASSSSSSSSLIWSTNNSILRNHLRSLRLGLEFSFQFVFSQFQDYSGQWYSTIIEIFTHLPVQLST